MLLKQVNIVKSDIPSSIGQGAVELRIKMVPVYLWAGVGEIHSVGYHSILYSFSRYLLRPMMYRVLFQAVAQIKDPNHFSMEVTF